MNNTNKIVKLTKGIINNSKYHHPNNVSIHGAWNTVKIIKTTDYFNKSIEELSELRNDGTWTREECLICDDGLVVHWFNSLETLSKNINTKTEKCNGYDLELKSVLELQVPNTNNNKYAMVFD